ncbi:MAG: ribonuclease R [candidate division FCPU426 bacterium]
MSKRKFQSGPAVLSGTILSHLHAGPLSLRQLLQRLRLPAGRRRDLAGRLQSLQSEGQIVRLRGGLFGLPASGFRAKKQQSAAKPAKAAPAPRERRGTSAAILRGRLQQSQPGFGFVIPLDAGQTDCYVAGPDLLDALPEDLVEVRVFTQPGRRPGEVARRRGQIVRVLERARQTVVGVLSERQGQTWIKPEGFFTASDLVVPANRRTGAKSGQKVVARVTVWPRGLEPGQAHVEEVLGRPDEPGVDITSLIRRFEIPDRFSAPAWEQAAAAAREPDEAACRGRLDLRKETIFTIDGADARDFDDAVSCADRPGGGWHLGVHIADVAHYLAPGSLLDAEARERGTSVYLPDRVLHMLPEPLSCGVCSLRPDLDRLAVSALLTVEPDGRVSHAEFSRSVIHSAARLTYEGVEEVLAGRPAEDPAGRFIPELKRLWAVSQALRRQRMGRGSLDFDLPDPRVVLGPDGRVTTIERRPQLASHRLIEDCMLAANEAVARHLQRHSLPTLYRIHETPDGEKLEDFREFIAAYGYELRLGKPREAAKAFQKLLRSWQDKPEAPLLNMSLLRAMKLAVYSPRNQGHFGLASACYTHFTSPIRRYPDLLVHRQLVASLAGKPLALARLELLGMQLSATERRAEKAEREAVKLKQAEFMSDKIGRTYSGVIGSVANFGFFVELDEVFVEGLVRIPDLLDDYYYFDDRKRVLVGANHGRLFATGDKVSVRVAAVDQAESRVYFRLDEEPPAAPARRNPPRVAKRGGRRRL